MDRAIIIGPFGFLGYSICKAMLENGCQVLGIAPERKDAGGFTDEKKLEIGRNANFIEKANKEWLSESEKKPAPIIFPFYDYYMERNEMLLFDNPFFSQYLSTLPSNNSRVIFLFPEQFAREEDLKSDRLKEFEAVLEEKECSGPKIYLPSLYGPWQPKEYTFQQVLFNAKGSNPSYNERESVLDAVYIEDAASLCLELLGEREGEFLISSGSQASWEDCLKESFQIAGKKREGMKPEELWKRRLKQAVKNELPGCKGKITAKIAPKPMGIRAGLENQYRQYVQWLQTKML
jgi:hypothetical protein